MTKNEILKSETLLKHFCKTCNLPITIFQNPYFESRLKVTNRQYDSIAKFKLFCKCLERYKNEQEYLTEYKRIKESVIQNIQSNPDYSRFCDKMNAEPFRGIFPKTNLYSETNNEGLFISIDLKSANFSAMRYYGNNIFDGTESWQEFISRYTDNAHIIQSKYIRQVILGACNPKCQVRAEGYLTGFLCNYITDEMPNAREFIFSVTSDEIILKLPPHGGFGMSFNDFKALVEKAPRYGDLAPFSVGEIARVRMFQLYKIPGIDGYIKAYVDEPEPQIEFKHLEADLYPQIAKYYYDEPIDDMDLAFYHNGRLAAYLEPIDNPWETPHQT